MNTVSLQASLAVVGTPVLVMRKQKTVPIFVALSMMRRLVKLPTTLEPRVVSGTIILPRPAHLLQLPRCPSLHRSPWLHLQVLGRRLPFLLQSL